MTKIDIEIADEAPYITADQRHLDANTPERAYWHYGYQAALRDVLALAERSTEDRCSRKLTAEHKRKIGEAHRRRQKES
jgi:hypothetical protein